MRIIRNGKMVYAKPRSIRLSFEKTLIISTVRDRILHFAQNTKYFTFAFHLSSGYNVRPHKLLMFCLKPQPQCLQIKPHFNQISHINYVVREKRTHQVCVTDIPILILTIRHQSWRIFLTPQMVIKQFCHLWLASGRY